MTIDGVPLKEVGVPVIQPEIPLCSGCVLSFRQDTWLWPACKKPVLSNPAFLPAGSYRLQNVSITCCTMIRITNSSISTFPAQLHTETSEWFSENQRKACESPEIGLISVLILWKVTFPVLLSIEKCFAHLLWNWIATDNVESSQPSPRPQFEDLRTGLFVRT